MPHHHYSGEELSIEFSPLLTLFGIARPGFVYQYPFGWFYSEIAFLYNFIWYNCLKHSTHCEPICMKTGDRNVLLRMCYLNCKLNIGFKRLTFSETRTFFLWNVLHFIDTSGVYDCYTKMYFAICFNSLGPNDAIWRWRSWSTLVQVMACCLAAPDHYLNQCWLIINKVLRHSSEDIIIKKLKIPTRKTKLKVRF